MNLKLLAERVARYWVLPDGEDDGANQFIRATEDCRNLLAHTLRVEAESAKLVEALEYNLRYLHAEDCDASEDDDHPACSCARGVAVKALAAHKAKKTFIVGPLNVTWDPSLVLLVDDNTRKE